MDYRNGYLDGFAAGIAIIAVVYAILVLCQFIGEVLS